MSMEKLNPQIREVFIGVRNLRPIKVYPLSMADQFRMTDIFRAIVGKVTTYFSEDSHPLNEFAEFIQQTIVENLPNLLKYVCPDDEISLDELTNFQLTEIVAVVYKDNYEDAGKNVQSLAEKMKMFFLSTRS